jgi:hypothetical protein
MSRILIVEDDPAILCGLRDNLEFESHQSRGPVETHFRDKHLALTGRLSRPKASSWNAKEN